MAEKVLPARRTLTPIMHTIHNTFVLYLILSSLVVGPTNSHQCPAKCDQSLCNLDKPCPGNVVLDMCNCCHECAKQVNESCGGKYSYEGKCDEKLVCFISPLAGSFVTGQETGVCAEISTTSDNDDGDSYEDDDTCSQVKCEELMSTELPPPPPKSDMLICPSDSRARPNQTAVSIVERCCNHHGGGQWSPSLTCQCLPCRSVTPLEQVVCPTRYFPILKLAGDMTPGRCCDKYECVEKEKFCSTIQCNDDSQSSSSSSSSSSADFSDDSDYDDMEEPLSCPGDSVEAQPDSNFDMCCPRNRGCTCKPQSSCLSLDLLCPSGTTKRILEHGNGVPGTCCSKFDCLNVTLAMVTPCNYDGKTFESGTKWVVDSCTNCTCDSGLVKCTKTQCPESTTRCEWIGQPDDGSCCPVCKGCVASEKNQNGGFHANGDRWTKDSCTSCRCENGQTYCMAQFCDTKCAKPRVVEGRCCPVCDEGENVAFLPPQCKPLKNCNLTCSGGYVRDRDLCPVCECSSGNENDDGNTITDECDLDCASSGYATDPLTGRRLCRCAAPYGSGTREPSFCPSPINCSRQCLYGYGRDKFGCRKCRCNRCLVFECSKKCPAGYQKNEDGCRICKCIDSGVFSPVHPDSHKFNKVPGSRGRPCISTNSRHLTDGQAWWDGCRKCFCHHGYEMCELVTCPPIRCTTPIMEPGSCCLTCPYTDPPKMLEGSGTCQSSDGRYFVDGETWSLDQCTQCICHMGVPLCTIDTCPPILCHHPVKPDDSCCPVCRHSAIPSQPRLPSNRHHLGRNRQCAATSNGTRSSNGDFWRVSPCQSCVCRDGQLNCFSQTCPILGCNRTVLKKGQCCPSCLDNAVQYCIYNGLNYDNGESWLVDDCTTCACVDGHVLCIMSVCERLTCPQPVSVPGKCCPMCPNKSSTCSDKDNPSLSSPGAETGRSINVTLVIILITIIAILAFAIIMLLGMLLWLRPRLSRRLRRTSSATLPASLPSLNPLSLFGGGRDHQPLNNEKSVSSSLLPLNSVSSMVANHQSAPGNQRSILLSGSPIHMNMMESANSTQKLRLSTGDPTFDAPSLSAAISSMTTASLASSSLSSAAAKKRLSSLDSCSADHRLTASVEMIKESAPDSKMHTDDDDDDDENALPPPLPRRRPPPNDPSDFFAVDVVVDNDDDNALGDGANRALDFSDSYNKLSTDLMNSSDVSLSEDGPPNVNGVNGINLFRKTKNYSGNIDVELTRHLLSSSPTNTMPIHNRKSW